MRIIIEGIFISIGICLIIKFVLDVIFGGEWIW